jgi:hypothetical protein
MNHQKLLERMIGLALSALILVGCGGSSQPRVGHWEGEAVSFTVTDEGTITEFEITVGNCQVTVDDEIAIDFGGSLGAFTINPEGVLMGGNAETATDFSAEAKFDSETALSGTYSYRICGGFMNLSEPTDVAWTAEWQEPQ